MDPRSILVSRVAPAIVGGNAVVVLTSESQPLAAVELAEVLATSDLPGGVEEFPNVLIVEGGTVARDGLVMRFRREADLDDGWQVGG